MKKASKKTLVVHTSKTLAQPKKARPIVKFKPY